MQTLTWKHEEFALTDHAYIPVVADIEFDERSPSDWTVARVGTFNPWKEFEEPAWLPGKHLLSVALIERINERYSREVALFIREEEYAA
jgi:hypothetical protein